MKLSEAIMLNGMTKPQGFGANSVYSIDAPCAIGGALQAIGKQRGGFGPLGAPYTTFECEWPWVAANFTCPACGFKDNGTRTIFHLNDNHRWTRQQIAEWVQSVEPADIPAEAEMEETLCTAQK